MRVLEDATFDVNCERVLNFRHPQTGFTLSHFSCKSARVFAHLGNELSLLLSDFYHLFVYITRMS